jgi:hypothetical protein
MALVSGAAFCALAGVGVTYVVTAEPSEPATLTQAPPSPTSAPDPSLSPSVSPATPGYAVTLTARPQVRVPPRPSPEPRKPTPTPTPQAPQAPPELDFRLTTFNVLGASHTRRGGSRPGFASGRARAGGVAALLARHGTDVAGFQELQGPQLAVLQARTGMDFFPGFSMGHLGTENSIGWRRDSWTAVEKRTVAIPYFNGGVRQMPYVRLKNLDTGIEAWFANVHNPAETAQFHHQQRFRVRATHIEAQLARRLVDTTGLPVFLTGDMNELAPYFCRLTAAAPMVAARGGSNNTGACLAGRPRAVDWIFGSQGVDFTSYDEDRSHLVDVTTDHPVVTAGVHLVGKPTG